MKIISTTNNPLIILQMAVYKGDSGVLEDFSRAKLFAWAIGPNDRWPLNVSVREDGLVECVLRMYYGEESKRLEAGAYSFRLVWVKESVDNKYVDPGKLYSTGQKRLVADVVNAFMLTNEAHHVVQEGRVELRFKTKRATYGYDGLSAYELAVMRGYFSGTEEDYAGFVRMVYDMHVPKSGTWDRKPTNATIGLTYFCTDKAIPIFYKGNNVWVDSLGNVLEGETPEPPTQQVVTYVGVSNTNDPSRIPLTSLTKYTVPFSNNAVTLTTTDTNDRIIIASSKPMVLKEAGLPLTYDTVEYNGMYWYYSDQLVATESVLTLTHVI